MGSSYDLLCSPKRKFDLGAWCPLCLLGIEPPVSDLSETGAPDIERRGLEFTGFDIPNGLAPKALQLAVLALDDARVHEDQDWTTLVLKIAHIRIEGMRGTASIES